MSIQSHKKQQDNVDAVPTQDELLDELQQAGIYSAEESEEQIEKMLAATRQGHHHCPVCNQGVMYRVRRSWRDKLSGIKRKRACSHCDHFETTR